MNLVTIDEARTDLDQNDVKMAFEICHTLNRHYQGHRFAVNVDSRTGLATIRHEADLLEGRDHGFVVPLNKLNADPSYKSAVMAAGEILERHDIKRGAKIE